MNVGELIELLQGLPPDTPILTTDAELAGLGRAGVALAEVQQLDRHGGTRWLCDFQVPAEARRWAALPAGDPELVVGGIGSPPPTLVGPPITAVVIHWTVGEK